MRVILVPQFPVSMRYQEWWYREFPVKLSKFFDVKVLGSDFPFENVAYDNAMFSPINTAIEFETYQIQEYVNNIVIKDDDILLLNDISFPGLFSNVLYHKRPKHCFAICHATSKNAFDYFEPVRKSKWEVECGHAKIFDKIFVATEYHKEFLGWDNTVVTSLPKHEYSRYMELKEFDIVSVSRPTTQKVNSDLERIIETSFNKKIIRNTFSNWDDYYSFLSKSRCLFISSSAETFGYQILDAVYNNCIPIAPRRFSYPELLPDEYLYDNKDEAKLKVQKVLSGQLSIPKILCQDKIDNFYNKLIGEI